MPRRRPRPASKRPENSAVAPAWVVRCAPGLSKLLVTEMRFNGLIDRATRPTIKWQRNHDLVFLPRLRKEPRPTDLRIAEEIHRCPVYGRYKISHHQLDLMAATFQAARGGRRLIVGVDGKHFNRHELARWLARELAGRGAPPEEGAEQLTFLFCIDEAYYVCLPYRSADEAALRDKRVAEREGSLPPTIAAAMAFLANPKASDAILDPVCGTGTLLAEAHAYAPEAHLWGMDLDRQAVSAARRNLAHLPHLNLRAGDGRKTGLPEGSVSLLLANLPFGKQFGSRTENQQLYDELFREMRRLARDPSWRGVVLTSDRDSLHAAVEANGTLRLTGEIAIRIRGEAASIFSMSQR